MMNKMRNSKSTKSRLILMAFFTIVSMVSLDSASAKEHKAKQSENEAQVVAHISFSGLSVVDMAMQRKVNDKYYLYVEHSEDQGISIIDVSKPAQPKALGVIPWPDPALSSRMSLTGAVAIISEREALPMHSRASTDDLVLWDLSNPD